MIFPLFVCILALLVHVVNYDENLSFQMILAPTLRVLMLRLLKESLTLQKQQRRRDQIHRW